MPLANRSYASSKVPEIFLIFWVVKLLTTGIGETASDFLGNWSIPVAAVVGVGGFFAALWWQLRATAYHPVRYWITVLAVALFGTMVADGPHVALGTPYYIDSAVYFVLLVGLLWWWKRSEGTLDIHSITTSRRERFYWGTVLLTFGLGTALGDTTATNLNMGFGWSVLLFGVLMLVPLTAWRLGASSVVCFWAAYALTRPLGASIADGLAVSTKDHPAGLGWTTGIVTAGGLVLFAALLAYIAIKHVDAEVGKVGLEFEAERYQEEPEGGAV